MKSFRFYETHRPIWLIRLSNATISKTGNKITVALIKLVAEGDWRQTVQLHAACATSEAASTTWFDAGIGLYEQLFALHPSEADEHLFQCSLTEWIVLNVECRPSSLHSPEQLRPRHSRRPSDMVVDKSVVMILQLATWKSRANVVHQYSHIGLQWFSIGLFVCWRNAQLDDERVTFAELCLEMLSAAETLESTVDHDSHPRT